MARRDGAGRSHRSGQVLARREIVAALYLKRNQAGAIAEYLRKHHAHLACSSTQIYCDIKRLRKEWRESALFDFNEVKRQEYEQLLLAREEAWAAYHRTIGECKTITIEGKQSTELDYEPGAKNVSVKKEMLPGSAQWMAIIVQINREIRALLCLDEPGKERAYEKDVSGMTDEELEGVILNEQISIRKAIGSGNGHNGNGGTVQ